MFVLHWLPQTIAPFVVWESWRTKCMKEVANSIILLFTGVETGVPQAPQTNCQPLLSSRISSINSSLSEVFRPNLLFMHIWARESLRSLSLIHVAGSRHIGKTVFTTTFAANIDQQLTVLPPLVLQSCSQGAFAFPKDQCHCLLGILSFWKGNGQREMENWRYVYPYFHPYHGDDFQGFVLRKKKLYFVCMPLLGHSEVRQLKHRVLDWRRSHYSPCPLAHVFFANLRVEPDLMLWGRLMPKKSRWGWMI